MSVFIIAEAGVNHNGNLNTALKLADYAKEAGADCVKFQTYKSENLVTRNAEKAAYQIRNTKESSSQFQMLKALELSENDFYKIKKHCDNIGIEFLSTAFDLDSIDLLQRIGCKRWKIPSGEITDYPYLAKLALLEQPIILSTGMCTYEDIDACLNVLKNNGANDITLLHCTTEYPTPFDAVNLKAMPEMGKRYGCPIGYSDHTQGIKVSLYAAAMGAMIIEKHFTLDKTMSGPDHKASLEPNELKMLVNGVREVEIIMGNGNKIPQEVELQNLMIARKSIVAKCKIKKGELLTEQNLTTKRPGNGLSPMLWNKVIGTKAIQDFEKDQLIFLS